MEQSFSFPGGRIKGCFHVIGDISSSNQIRIAEGFATAASISAATDEPCVVAFNSSNLGRVARELKQAYPDKVFVVCGDDDRWTTRLVEGTETPYNPGRESATEAAKACLGKAVFPIFKDLIKKQTDFNDLAVGEGLEIVKKQLSEVVVDKLYLTPLGHCDGEYFFTSSSNKQVTNIRNFSDNVFANLMPLEYWEAVFPGKGKASVDWEAAKFKLTEECRKIGIFQPKNIRGAGTWYDEGRVVVNMGDHLIVDGLRVELGYLPSKYFYTLGVKLRGLHQNPLSLNECDILINACSHFKWLKPDYSFVLSGALVVSRVCGALPIRPHIWITGSAQTGKTTLLQRLIRPIIAEPCFYANGGSSEAGVRHDLKANAIPILFDEFETTGHTSAEKIAGVIELLRSSWSESDAMIVKGSAGGNAVKFQLRSSAIVSSIRLGLKNDADRGRFSVIELAPHGEDEAHWKILCSMLDKIDEEYSDRLFARTIKMIPILLANFKKLKSSFAKRSSQRFGDQYGMILAGYSILISDEALTEAEADLLVSNVRLDEEREDAKVSDHEECLIQLITKKTSLEVGQYKHDYSLGRAIIEAASDELVNEALQELGIRVKLDKVAIAVKHTQLENEVYKGSRWSNGWSHSLSRLKEAEKNRVVWIAGKGQKCVIIPMHHFKSNQF